MTGEFRIKKQRIRVNNRIYADKVRLIGHDKEQIGVVTVPEALNRAEDVGLDLVEISPNAKP
ncbi:translation initiation factor IF-3, partial [Candidatus Marinimicrobia bacterium]|nr:translation initiation factor IF-3 [Candidatus Neomarinimicrobiota bacterium]